MKTLKNLLLAVLFLNSTLFAQDDIPQSHSNIHNDDNGQLYWLYKGQKIYEKPRPVLYTLKNIYGNPKGTNNGISFDFNNPDFSGILYYGFIPYGDSKYPLPVYFNSPAKIDSGKAEINIKKGLSGKYDMIGWQKSARGTLGYRVVNGKGVIIYDGKVSFKGIGPFAVDVTILEGPFVNLLLSDAVTISFKTNAETNAKIIINDQSYYNKIPTKNHEIKINDLKAGKTYTYRLLYGENEQIYHFKTAPEPGSRKPFVFSYCSDSRVGTGGGERNIWGVNSYVMRKIMALSAFKNVDFMQFTGDLIDGYLTDVNEMNLQYANWKRATEPFSHYFPIYVAMGNHEVIMRNFGDLKVFSKIASRIDRFPYDTESAEFIFAENFVNPLNGPVSEDETMYDPDPHNEDFPSYTENVYYYIYDNTAMIVLNSDYWYAPSTSKIPYTSGGVHGYIMDNQLDWLRKTIAQMEADQKIDHIFITLHTPFFPNGGHVEDDMWYNGNNKIRPFIAGKPVNKGIIERRDQLLDLLVNKSDKVVALLTGDEHNYNKLQINKKTNIYPPDYDYPKLELSRTIYQINNGAAGAPYYAQEQTPWTPQVSGFTTQNALVFFHIDGQSIHMEVINPVTLEEIDQLTLR